jgi:hypothetical protein
MACFVTNIGEMACLRQVTVICIYAKRQYTDKITLLLHFYTFWNSDYKRTVTYSTGLGRPRRKMRTSVCIAFTTKASTLTLEAGFLKIFQTDPYVLLLSKTPPGCGQSPYKLTLSKLNSFDLTFAFHFKIFVQEEPKFWNVPGPFTSQ